MARRNDDRGTAAETEALGGALFGSRHLQHPERIDQGDVLARPDVGIRAPEQDFLAAGPDHRRRHLAYERGDFNAGALTLGTGHTVASIREGLRAKGITLLTAIA